MPLVLIGDVPDRVADEQVALRGAARPRDDRHVGVELVGGGDDRGSRMLGMLHDRAEAGARSGCVRGGVVEHPSGHTAGRGVVGEEHVHRGRRLGRHVEVMQLGADVR